MTPKRLYIIGNGFDIHHDINSSYRAFESWLLKTKRLKNFDDVQEYFQCEDFWSSFEENLGAFDYISFAQDVSADNLPDMTSEHADVTRSDARCEVENRLDDWNKTIWGAFPAWLNQLQSPNLEKKININTSDSLFLNFNYTLTLENLYGIESDNIIHIHGKQGDSPGKLLLGHGGLTVHVRDPFAEYSIECPPDPNDQLAIEEAINAAKSYAEKWESQWRKISKITPHSFHLFQVLKKFMHMVFHFPMLTGNTFLPFNRTFQQTS